MTLKEFREQTKDFDENSELLVGAVNKERIPTYAVVDHVLKCDTETIINCDVIPTPGDIDERLLKIKSENVIYIGTRYGL